jgi:predicted GIY-YIG superfamily endonuclease
MSYKLPSRSDSLERQENHISEIIQSYDGFDGNENAVYVLKCHSPAHKNDIRPPHDEYEPTYVDEALLADHLYYVGWSNRVAHRILQHIRGTAEGANFTKQFPPETLKEIRWYDSEKRAKGQEAAVAEEYTQRVIDLSKLDEMETVNKTDGVVEWYEIANAIDEFEISIAYYF